MCDRILYYIRDSEMESGPHTLGDLQELWRAGAIDPNSEFHNNGCDVWLPISEIMFLLDPEYKQPGRTTPCELPPLPRSALGTVVHAVTGLFRR